MRDGFGRPFFSNFLNYYEDKAHDPDNDPLGDHDEEVVVYLVNGGGGAIRVAMLHDI